MVEESLEPRAYATDGPTEAVMTEERPLRPQSAAHDDEEYARAHLQTLTRRRKAAEAAALAAENAASDAATRASAAIAAAARAAQEAEDAADEAARAAEEAAEALEAERQAAAQVTAVTGGQPADQTGAQPPAPRTPSDRPAPPRRPKQSPPPPPPADPPNRHAVREEPVSERDDDDSVPTSRMPAVPPASPPVAGPADGRRVRRRVQEVNREASRDPATEIIPVRQRAEKPPAPAREDEQPQRKRRWSLPSFGKTGRITPVVLAAIGVGLVLAMAVVLTTFMGNAEEPAPAAVVGVAPPTTVEAAPASATRPAVDPKSKKATAFLGAMRRGGIPVSNSGLPETEAAAVICEQLEQGAKEDALVRSVPAVLPTVTKAQSGDVVRLAKQHYC
jgi:hypothetical protein